MTEVLTTTIKPTEAVTWFNLALIGFIGGIGVMILSEKTKDKTWVPVRELAFWGGVVPAIITIAAVYSISKSSK